MVEEDRLAELEMDYFEKYNGEDFVSKPNRRKRGKMKVHSTIVGPLPPTGIHEESRKDRDRKINQAIKKAIK